MDIFLWALASLINNTQLSGNPLVRRCVQKYKNIAADSNPQGVLILAAILSMSVVCGIAGLPTIRG